MKAVTVAQVRQYLAKAEEFHDVAEDCLAASRNIAATGNAVHAAINAADAVGGALTSQRSAAPAHGDATVLLRQAGPDGVEVAKQLARVLPLKTRAEYEPDQVPRNVAARAVTAARRAVAVARRVVPSRTDTVPQGTS
jgi:hypothetical protein